MCGITLVYHTDGKPVNRAMLMAMNRTLNHRGPDANGLFIQQHCGLGHTRLSIVDIQGGAQPLHTHDQRYTISYNGEIYNYRPLREALEQSGAIFHTQTDTEVIVELYRRYQTEALDKLRGMFSFAIFDHLNQTLFCARDRVGIKPFYYHWNGSSFIAASEIKAIFATGLVEPKFNTSSIHNHFNYQFSISPYTVFESIVELPPGHFVTLNLGQTPTPKQYWDLEFPTDDQYESRDPNYWRPRYETAMHEAAATHTIGDVPIATYLSGGIDSSAMAYLLKQNYPELMQSFSIHFTNPDSDESYAYQPVAQHLQIDNNELVIDDNPPGGYFSLLRDCLYHLEQPQRLAVDLPHFLLSQRVQQQNYKVVYTGDGADEILAGYDCFRQDSMRINGNLLADEAAREQLYFSEYTQYFSEEYMTLLLNHHHPDQQSKTIETYGCYPAWYDFWQVLNTMRDKVLLPNENKNTQMTELLHTIKPKLAGRHRINQSLYLEAKTRLPSWILWKSDRLSMAHSVEARVPFMDHPLIELSAQLPPDLKLDGMNEKAILKSITQPHLPNIPGDYKKRAFYTPIREWFFTKQHRSQLNTLLSKTALDQSGLFDYPQVKQLIDTLLKHPKPTDLSTYYYCMQLEWTLMLVLSTQMLYELYILKQAPCFDHLASS